jgi:hypothetical protein
MLPVPPKAARFILLLSLLLPVSALLPRALRAAEALQEVVVKSGDSLWGIANYYLKDPKKWPELLKHNPQLTNDPTVALPGMRLRVPVMLIKEQLRAAELVYLLKEVRYRRKQTNEWRPAQVNMELYNEDGLRTMGESAARIRFPSGDVLNLSENSLIVIQPEKGRETVQLMSGAVKARQARVITAGGARVDPLGADAEYRTRVRQDNTELVLVYRGRVDVTAQGKTVRIPEGFGSEIRPLMPPTEPMPLPKMPQVRDFEAPSLQKVDAEVRLRSDEKALVLSVQVPDARDVAPAPGRRDDASRSAAVPRRQMLEKFHVQVDRDAEFRNPSVDRIFALSEKFDLKRLGLETGRYHWRISFIDTLGMEGPFSAAQAFQIDRDAPLLTVAVPHDGMEVPWEEEFVQVAGETEPGCAVRVDDKPASVGADGRFSSRLYLHEGKNRLDVVSVDENGNEARLERVVYRLMPGEKTKTYASSRRRPAGGEERDGGREGGLAGFGVGLLTIGTLIGIILLIVG